MKAQELSLHQIEACQGQFLRIDSWVGYILDLLQGERRLVLAVQSLYGLYWHNRMLLFLPPSDYRMTSASPEDVVADIARWDRAYTDTLTALARLQQNWEDHVTPSTPFPSIGHFVQVADWVGEIVDIATYSQGQHWWIRSAKQCQKNAETPTEWLLDAERFALAPTTRVQAVQNCQTYIERTQQRYHTFERIAHKWRRQCT